MFATMDASECCGRFCRSCFKLKTLRALSFEQVWPDSYFLKLQALTWLLISAKCNFYSRIPFVASQKTSNKYLKATVFNGAFLLFFYLNERGIYQ